MAPLDRSSVVQADTATIRAMPATALIKIRFTGEGGSLSGAPPRSANGRGQEPAVPEDGPSTRALHGAVVADARRYDGQVTDCNPSIVNMVTMLVSAPTADLGHHPM